MKDRTLRVIDKLFLLWVALGLIVPFALGWLIGGSLGVALATLLWAGLIRIFLLHHVTWSINSVCHFFGRRRFQVDDESRNVFWLAPFSMGEAWHHNHHAFPTSAFHGLRFWERVSDPTGLVIAMLEKLGLVWNVVRISARAAGGEARGCGGGSALFERRHRQAGTVETDPVGLGVLASATPDDRAAVVVDAIREPVTLSERDSREYTQRASQRHDRKCCGDRSAPPHAIGHRDRCQTPARGAVQPSATSARKNTANRRVIKGPEHGAMTLAKHRFTGSRLSQ